MSRSPEEVNAVEAVAEARAIVGELSASGRTDAELIIAEAEALAMCLMALSKLPAALRKNIAEYLNERFAKTGYLQMLTLVIEDADVRIAEAKNAQIGAEMEVDRLQSTLESQFTSSAVTPSQPSSEETT